MMRHVSGWVVLLLLAISFVVGLLWVRSHPAEIEDPLAEAQEEINRKFGFLVETTPGPKGGLTIQGVTPNSPAVHLGFQAGDRVLAVNERSVWHAVQLRDLIAEKLSRGPVALMVEREGVFRLVVLGARAAPGRAGPGVTRGTSPRGAPARAGRTPPELGKP